MKWKTQRNDHAVPPRWARWLLTWLHPENTLEEVDGDLDELYAHWYQKSGRTAAGLNYFLNVISVLPPFVRRRKRSTEYHNTFLLQPGMIRNYFKIAFRTLAANKVYSSINVIGLSIGLAAAMMIMLYTKDEVSFDRFHDRADQIYRIVMDRRNPDNGELNHTGSSGLYQGPKFSAGIPEIETYVRMRSEQRDVRQRTGLVSEEIRIADPNFFSVFSFPLLYGNPGTALDQPNSVVIDEDIAKAYFGTANALGKTIQMRVKDAFEPFLVTGVAKKAPQNSSIKFRFVVPMVISPQELAGTDWGSYFLNTFVVLKPGSDVKAVEAKMKRVFETDAKDFLAMSRQKYNDRSVTTHSLQLLTSIHLNEKSYSVANGLSDSSNPLFSYLLSGIVLFILMIACINFVNLTIARSLKRAKEIGVRKVVGGGRAQLVLQFLGESFTLCFLAFLLAIVIAQLALPAFNSLSNKALSLEYLFDWKLVSGYFLLFLLTGFSAGFYPAMVISGFKPVQALYGRFTFSGKNYMQKGLIVLQFTLASVLIIGTMTIFSQFDYLTKKPLGYDFSNTIILQKRDLKRSEVQLLRQELMKNPGIVSVATKNGGRSGTGALINNGTEVGFDYETVDEYYIPLYKIPMASGRNFSPQFSTDSSNAVVVNESFVRQAGWKDPLGQEIDFQYQNHHKYKVIGVVKDYHFLDLHREIGPQLFTMRAGNPIRQLIVRIKPGSETASLQTIEKTFTKLFPIEPFQYEFRDRQLLKSYESEARWKQLVLSGTVLTIFISCIGLFGLATLSAERRTKEVGIRKVLGASVTAIVQLLSLDFLKLVCFSFIVAFPLAYYAVDQWLRNYPYRVDINAWTFIITSGLTLAIAFLAVGFQSLQAAFMNPVKSLRNE